MFTFAQKGKINMNTTRSKKKEKEKRRPSKVFLLFAIKIWRTWGNDRLEYFNQSWYKYTMTKKTNMLGNIMTGLVFA